MLSGFSSFASAGDIILNSPIVVFVLMVNGVGVVCHPDFLFDAVDMELAVYKGTPLQWLVAGIMTPVVSMADDTSVYAVVICVVSAGIVMGCFIWTLYSFLFLVFLSVSMEYVRWGKFNSPWLTSRMALLFLRNVRSSMGPVIRLATMNVSPKFQSPISNWATWFLWVFDCCR